MTRDSILQFSRTEIELKGFDFKVCFVAEKAKI